MPPKRTKFEVEAGIPGLLKGKISRDASPTRTDWRYSCSVSFTNPDDATAFRMLVEEAASDCSGRLEQSHLDTVEITVDQ